MKTHRLDPSTGAIDTAASAWVIRRDAGLTAAEEVDFERWRSADPRHYAALAAHEQAWSVLDRPRQAGEGDFMRREYQVRAARRRKKQIGGGVVVLGIFLVTGLAWRSQQQPAAVTLPSANTAVVIVPIRQTLADGSRVDLKSSAEIAVAFEAKVRRVALLKGEAHFEVAKNPARPFIVSAAGIEVRAVGTAFSVQLGAQEIAVLVTEGRVSIDRASHGSTSAGAMQVDAGYRLVLPVDSNIPATTVAVSRPEIDEQLAWRQAHLEFTDTPLGEAVALLNQYAARHGKTRLVIDDPAAAAVPVSGFFRADSLDAFVRLIEASTGLKTDRSGDTITLRAAR